MTFGSWFPMAGSLGLVILVGCGGEARVAPPAEETGMVRGTVAYRQRVALPPDAVAEVWITDVSPGNLAVPVIAETTVASKGRQVPLPFELRYEPGMIQPDHEYAVRAVIRSEGRALFQTGEAHPVITKGHPTEVELWLDQVVDQSTGETDRLVGSAWRLEDLAGAAVLDGVDATLEFPEPGKVAGSGSCNRFFGSVEIAGQSLSIGALGSTRMACSEAVMDQEGRYFRALEGAERFTHDGVVLLIHAKGLAQPLRFVRTNS